MSVLIALVGVVVTATIGWFTARRSQYDRVLNVIDYISGSEVAEARHNLGSLVANRNRDIDQHLNEDELDSFVKDLFTVLWAFQRIHAVDRSIPAWQILGPKRLLRDSTVEWVNYWSANLNLVRSALGLDPAATNGSDSGLTSLAEVWLGGV